MRSGEIKTSLFAATDAAGIPDGVAVQLADIFGGDVDFHRDLRRGDRFGSFSKPFPRRPNDPIRASARGRISSQRKTYRAVWFQDPWGRGGYYTPEGDNLRKYFYARRSSSRASPRDSACAAIRFSSSGARIGESTMEPRSEQG